MAAINDFTVGKHVGPSPQIECQQVESQALLESRVITAGIDVIGKRRGLQLSRQYPQPRSRKRWLSETLRSNGPPQALGLGRRVLDAASASMSEGVRARHLVGFQGGVRLGSATARYKCDGQGLSG